jgi:oligopeptide/dipeptide ABC transporter ATP-binding protein
MNGSMLRAESLLKTFPVGGGLIGVGRRVIRAVDGVDLQVQRGETFAVVGESGCGKSTLARMLVGLLEPTSGAVFFKDERMRAAAARNLRRHIQIVFQDPVSSLNPRKTIGQILARPLAIHGLATGDREGRVRELLHLVQLDVDSLDRYPHEFSGGQQQRIGIARALATDPEIIIADEPVSALDVSVQAQIIALLGELKRRLGLTLVLITHDLAVVKYMADRVAVMYMGRVVEQGTIDEVFARPLHPYTAALMASTGVPDPRLRGRRQPPQGELPSSIDPPSGCRFRTRCPARMPVCERVTPALLAMGPTRLVACHLYPENAPDPENTRGLRQDAQSIQ